MRAQKKHVRDEKISKVLRLQTTQALTGFAGDAPLLPHFPEKGLSASRAVSACLVLGCDAVNNVNEVNATTRQAQADNQNTLTHVLRAQTGFW